MVFPLPLFLVQTKLGPYGTPCGHSIGLLERDSSGLLIASFEDALPMLQESLHPLFIFHSFVYSVSQSTHLPPSIAKVGNTSKYY